jgi:hypothetical protein
MKLSSSHFKALTIAQVIAWAVFLTTPSFSAESRDILWHNVSICINVNEKNYCSRCSAPRVEIDCRTCRNSTQVWAESKEFAENI